MSPPRIELKRIYVDQEQVAEICALSVSTVQKLVRENQFPAPRQTSDRRAAWLLREVEAWAEGRPVSTMPPPPNTGSRRKTPVMQGSEQ